MEPIFIEPIVQRETGDCGIACLTMLTGKPYPDVVRAAPIHAHKRGMSMRQIIVTAEKLGVSLKLHRKIDPREDIGILSLLPEPLYSGKTKRDEHVVLLIEGQIYDALAGRLWLDVDIFLQTEKYRVGTLLKRVM